MLVEVGVDLAAPFGSILFDRPSDRGERDGPPMFGDLSLDQVFAAVPAGPPDNGNDGASLSPQQQRWNIVAVKSGPAEAWDSL